MASYRFDDDSKKEIHIFLESLWNDEYAFLVLKARSTTELTWLSYSRNKYLFVSVTIELQSQYMKVSDITISGVVLVIKISGGVSRNSLSEISDLRYVIELIWWQIII